jgi:hypothetical protein
MMPLPQVLAYNVTHLETAADHWEAVADHREETYAEVNNRARTVTWEGMSADAMHEHVGRDFNTAIQSANALRSAANQARRAASDLYSQHSRIIYNLEDVQADGFAVGPDYTVTDMRPSNSVAEQAQRAQLAVSHSADLRLKATNLTEADARVGAQLQTATAGEGKVQFVDFKTDGDYDPNQGGGNFERKFWNDVITDAIAGAAVGTLVDGVGAIPGAAAGGAWAAIKDGLHFIAGDGHDY